MLMMTTMATVLMTMHNYEPFQLPSQRKRFVLQCIALHCSTTLNTTLGRSTVQYSAVQQPTFVAVSYIATLQHSTATCTTLQYIAAHRSTLQYSTLCANCSSVRLSNLPITARGRHAVNGYLNCTTLPYYHQKRSLFVHISRYL